MTTATTPTAQQKKHTELLAAIKAKGLTDARAAALEGTGSAYKVSDGRRLYLCMSPDASRKTWRMEYTRPVSGKSNMLTFGEFPEVTCDDARAKAIEARKLLADRIDPADVRDAEKKAITELREQAKAVAAGGPLPGTFRAIALEFMGTQWREGSPRNKWGTQHAKKFQRTLEKYLFPKLGHLAIGELRAREHIAPVLNAIPFPAVQHDARGYIDQIFDHAEDTGACEFHPGRALKRLVQTSGESLNSQPAVLNEADARELIRAFDMLDGERVRDVLQMCLYTAQRPSNVCGMQWAHIDLDAARWDIPGELMKAKQHTKRNAAKMKTGHTVFLSRQAVELLRTVQAQCLPGGYVFPHGVLDRITGEKPMCRSALHRAIDRMGFSGRHTAHGFRAMFASMGEKVLEIETSLLDATLSHARGDRVARAYFRNKYEAKRAEVAQKWADYCDSLTAEPAPALRLVA